MKKVSIIIPVFNTKPQELDECLGACFRQGLSDDELEVILIDDGSTNPPQDIYEKYLSAHKNIVFLRQENRGVSATRNRGIDVSTAEYLCFVDSDDYLRDGILSSTFQLAKCDDLDIAYYNGHQEISEVCEGRSLLTDNRFTSAVWQFLLKTDFLRKSGIRFYEGKLCEDIVFVYELISVAKRVKVVSTGGYFYRYSENSIQRTHDLGRKMKFAKDGVLFAAGFFNSRLKDLQIGGGGIIC